MGSPVRRLPTRSLGFASGVLMGCGGLLMEKAQAIKGAETVAVAAASEPQVVVQDGTVPGAVTSPDVDQQEPQMTDGQGAK